jgi:hypothetical protein
MASEANGDFLYLGRGKFYFNRLLNGAYQGLRFIGNVSKGEITPTSTEKQIFASTKAAAPLLKTVTTQQTHTMTLDMSEWDAENVALGLFGTTSVVTQNTATVTAETIFTAASDGIKANTILRLANRSVSAVVLTATGSGSPTPLVAGTDYEIDDAVLGLIRILPTATTVALTAITLINAAYTAATSTFTRVAAGTDTEIVGQLVFMGDPASGPQMDVEVWKLRIKPSSALSLISDDFGVISLTGDVQDDSINHPNAPLYQVTYRTSAS